MVFVSIQGTAINTYSGILASLGVTSCHSLCHIKVQDFNIRFHSIQKQLYAGLYNEECLTFETEGLNCDIQICIDINASYLENIKEQKIALQDLDSEF